MEVLLLLFSTLLLLFVLVVAVESFASLLITEKQSEKTLSRPTVAVVIPAHDEALVIEATLASIRSQLRKGDRVLVVADNCSDETVSVVKTAGMTVVERHDDKRQGKGFALAFGLDLLRMHPPEVVIMIDADCILIDGGLDELACQAIEKDMPIQALNLMRNVAGASINLKVAEFAWVIKNHVRPLGLLRMGMPCQLMGTGMAFPWHVIKDSELANGAIVEDMQLGLRLAIGGDKPLFCPDACVTSYFPTSDDDAETQRRRWEHGHIGMILNYVPQLLCAALHQRDLGLLFIGLDLMVPPLALQSILLLAGLLFAACAIPFDIILPFIMLVFACFLFVFTILVAWFRYARHIIGAKEMFAIPHYIVSKITIYTSYMFSREKKWIRTGRDSND